MTRWRSKALLAGLTIIPAVAIGTSYTRGPVALTGPLCHPHEVTRQPGHTWTVESCGVVHGMDAQGFRMPGWRSWPADRAIIVAVGDSFTFGYGVEAEDAWPAQLGQLLGERVINAGIPGANASRIAEVVEQFYEPRSRCATIGLPAWAEPCTLKSSATREPYTPDPGAIVYGIYVNDIWPEGTQGKEGTSNSQEFFWHRSGDTQDAFERMVAAADKITVHALVLDRPGYENKWLTYQLEKLARRAGMHVIQVDYPDDCAPLAPDELHPNEACHRAYAAAVAGELR